jgi:hypothetical protein
VIKSRNLIKILREVEKKVDSALSFIEYVEALRIWKGRKVIPKDEWMEYHKSGQKKFKMKALVTYPDDFIEYIGVNDNQWYSDYIELLVKKKNPNYGKWLCNDCILNPEMQDTYGIRRILINAFKEDKNLKDPCSIVNRFECPYPETKDENSFSYIVLENLHLICETVDRAIARAIYLLHNDYYLYKIDFERSWIDTLTSYGGQYTRHPSIETELEDNFSDVPIRDRNDVVKALTNMESLGKLIDQEFKHQSNPDTELNDWLRKVIPNLFDDIKDRINIEDLHDIHPAKEIEDSIKYDEEHYDCKRIALGQCMYCNKVCNIYDTNCNKWLCKDHWREHQRTSHINSIKPLH